MNANWRSNSGRAFPRQDSTRPRQEEAESQHVAAIVARARRRESAFVPYAERRPPLNAPTAQAAVPAATFTAYASMHGLHSQPQPHALPALHQPVVPYMPPQGPAAQALPPPLSEQQKATISDIGGPATASYIDRNHAWLAAVLSNDDIVAIACAAGDGAASAFGAFHSHHASLRGHPYHFSQGNIVDLACAPRSAEAFQSLVQHGDGLLQRGFTPVQLLDVAIGGGSRAIDALQSMRLDLSQQPFRVDLLAYIARHHGGGAALYELGQEAIGRLRQANGGAYSDEQLTVIAAKASGGLALASLAKADSQLQAAGFTPDDLTDVASQPLAGGSRIAALADRVAEIQARQGYIDVDALKAAAISGHRITDFKRALSLV